MASQQAERPEQKTSTLSTEQQSSVSLFKPAPVCVCCVCVQCDISMYLRRSIYLPMYLSRIYMFLALVVLEVPVVESIMCVCVCVCVCVSLCHLIVVDLF
jgi:hypothetical protein